MYSSDYTRHPGLTIAPSPVTVLWPKIRLNLSFGDLFNSPSHYNGLNDSGSTIVWYLYVLTFSFIIGPPRTSWGTFSDITGQGPTIVDTNSDLHEISTSTLLNDHWVYTSYSLSPQFLRGSKNRTRWPSYLTDERLYSFRHSLFKTPLYSWSQNLYP